MTPKQVVEKWVEIFNRADADAIAELYAVDAINHQVMNEPLIGKAAIKHILEWKDPKGLRGCGFFNIKNDKIVFQRGYWDKLSFHKLYNIPL